MKKNCLVVIVLLSTLLSFAQTGKEKPSNSKENTSKVFIYDSKTKAKHKTDQVKISKKIHCKLQGNVVGEKSEHLFLIPQGEDPRHAGVKIPIINGHFECEITTDFTQQYTLVFEDELERGAFRPIHFFVENGVVEFSLHASEESGKNTITGGKLTEKKRVFETERNSKLMPFSKEEDSLWNANAYFSEAAKAIFAKMRGLEHGEELNKLYRQRDELEEREEGYTPQAWLVKTKRDSIQKTVYDWQNQYIKANQDIFSYSLLLNTFNLYNQYKKYIDLEVISSLSVSYSKKYPSHPYTKQIAEILKAINTIKVGSQYTDFSAPTIEGKVVRISEVVTGKVAIIDLWASWCGSCRVTSKSYIPIYEEYKTKGFQIIGVAAESKDTKAFKKAIEKDKLPWLNLIELDNKNRIWNKYNIPNAGGSTFLIDSKGVILAINPDAEQVGKILEKLL